MDVGVDRSSIKIRYSQIYVSGQLTGRVKNGVFVPAHSLGDAAPESTDSHASKNAVNSNNASNNNYAVNSNNAVNNNYSVNSNNAVIASPSSGTVSASN